MELICQNCGSKNTAYFTQDRHNWEVYVVEDHEGNPELAAQPDDHEETRYFFRKLTPPERVAQSVQAGQRLKCPPFDCRDCGEDNCVRVVET
jgi:hypothetical protein